MKNRITLRSHLFGSVRLQPDVWSLAQLLLVAAGLLAAMPAAAQPPEVLLAMSPTLGKALARSDFSDAANAGGAPDLNRELTSSGFATSDDSFVAAYYFSDELADQSLGPLHVSRFDRKTRRWSHAPRFDDHTRGSVLSVQISEEYLLIDLHWNPSAGRGVVLSASTLELVATIDGGSLHLMPDGSIRYMANLVHFAPFHQDRLLVLDPRTQMSVEVFPGERESTLATAYRDSIQRAYERLPQTKKDDYAMAHLRVDFDRSISPIHERADGSRMAFVAVYDAALNGPGAPEEFATIARCDRGPARSWSCSETAMSDVARSFGLTVQYTDSGRIESAFVDKILEVALRR